MDTVSWAIERAALSKRVVSPALAGVPLVLDGVIVHPALVRFEVLSFGVGQCEEVVVAALANARS
jgi:hypothetical protein